MKTKFIVKHFVTNFITIALSFTIAFIAWNQQTKLLFSTVAIRMFIVSVDPINPLSLYNNHNKSALYLTEHFHRRFTLSIRASTLLQRINPLNSFENEVLATTLIETRVTPPEAKHRLNCFPRSTRFPATQWGDPFFRWLMALPSDSLVYERFLQILESYKPTYHR